MPLDRISSATPYAALELVLAATANAPRLASPPAAPVSTAFTPDVKTLTESVNAPRSAVDEAAQGTPSALQAREDRLGQRLDVRA